MKRNLDIKDDLPGVREPNNQRGEAKYPRFGLSHSPTELTNSSFGSPSCKGTAMEFPSTPFALRPVSTESEPIDPDRTGSGSDRAGAIYGEGAFAFLVLLLDKERGESDSRGTDVSRNRS
ncbi:hypothetical protein AAFF_G00106770 [Aldrovandia affinis]|uniref:Uncharacterized protein n=1 Tax=Aldrovandia affinis TaxID=143900 RepID=A0AAD7T2N8_9TELE|nr:hypothetical protein AAFF_G00106770 [Aldrovandia affinis]